MRGELDRVDVDIYDRHLRELLCGQGTREKIYVDNSSSAQDKLQAQIDKLSKAKLESHIYSDYDEQYQGFVILGLILLLIDALLLERQNHAFNLTRFFKK